MPDDYSGLTYNINIPNCSTSSVGHFFAYNEFNSGTSLSFQDCDSLNELIEQLNEIRINQGIYARQSKSFMNIK